MLWSSIDYANHQTAKIQIKYLREITSKLLRMNNKLNMMNLGIANIWEYIHSKERHVNSLFKLNSVQYVRSNLIQTVKLFKRFLRRLTVELHLFKNQKPISHEFQIILLSNQLHKLTLKCDATTAK